MIALPSKGPSDVVDYTVTFTGLGGDTIASKTVTAVGSSGLAIASSPAPSHTSTTVTFWVNGGDAGKVASVTVQIVTAAARTIKRTFSIPIEDL